MPMMLRLKLYVEVRVQWVVEHKGMYMGLACVTFAVGCTAKPLSESVEVAGAYFVA